MDCVFCDRIENGDYIDVDYEVARFVPLNPVSAGHILFVPKKHLSDATCDPWTTARVMARAAEYADQRWRAGYHANIITSIGSHATQTIRHLHVHYVPRREGDGLLLPWSNRDAVRTARRSILDACRRFLDDDDLDGLRDALTDIQDALRDGGRSDG